MRLLLLDLLGRVPRRMLRRNQPDVIPDALQDAADFWEGEHKTLLVVVELEAPVLAPELPEVSGR